MADKSQQKTQQLGAVMAIMAMGDFCATSIAYIYIYRGHDCWNNIKNNYKSTINIYIIYIYIYIYNIIYINRSVCVFL